jgi:hypothetical protein
MKSLKSISVILFLFLCSFGAEAQSHLFGKWSGHCFFERKENGNLSFCGTCKTSIEGDKKSLTIEDLEIVIDDKNIQISSPGKTGVATPYTFDSKVETLSFTYEKVLYTYNILRGTDSDLIILKSSCGVLLLRKKG